MNVWRLSHRSNPCGFVPRRFCSWHGRFDDPQRRYRVLYAAAQPITCLRELLADLRPNARALADFADVFGELPAAGVVSAAWRRRNVLAYAAVTLSEGKLVNIDAPRLLSRLTERHASLLKAYGYERLDLKAVRSRQRVITKNLSRTLFEEGASGIRYGSRLDGKACVAVFEGRAALQLLNPPIPMTQDHPALVRVCGEYSLILRPV